MTSNSIFHARKSYRLDEALIKTKYLSLRIVCFSLAHKERNHERIIMYGTYSFNVVCIYTYKYVVVGQEKFIRFL